MMLGGKCEMSARKKGERGGGKSTRAEEDDHKTWMVPKSEAKLEEP